MGYGQHAILFLNFPTITKFMKFDQQKHREQRRKLTGDQLKFLSSYSIFFRPEKYDGEVEEYAGWVAYHDGVLHICILAEQFIGEGKLKPEVEELLERGEYRKPHCLYMVNSDEDMKLIRGMVPAKF